MALNWHREGDRIYSDEGYVITRTQNTAGKWFYNSWSPISTAPVRVIEAGYDADGLARCKSAAETHWNNSTNAAQAAGSNTGAEGAEEGR